MELPNSNHLPLNITPRPHPPKKKKRKKNDFKGCIQLWPFLTPKKKSKNRNHHLVWEEKLDQARESKIPGSVYKPRETHKKFWFFIEI